MQVSLVAVATNAQLSSSIDYTCSDETHDQSDLPTDLRNRCFDYQSAGTKQTKGLIIYICAPRSRYNMQRERKIQYFGPLIKVDSHLIAVNIDLHSGIMRVLT